MEGVWAPDFHEWGCSVDRHGQVAVGLSGGMNDRFAIGDAASMRVWAHRLDSTLAYVASGRPFHTETWLKWHMRRAAVPVHRMRFRLQRLRADGEVAAADRALACG